MAGLRTFTRAGVFIADATPLTQPVAIEPPFHEAVPDKTTPDKHSQPWNAWFTDTAQRVAELTTAVADLTYAVAHIKDGVVDGSDAPPGLIGEYLSASATVGLSSATPTDIVTLTLPAGDWDVSGSADFSFSALTLTFASAWLSTTSGVSSALGRSAIQTGGGGVLGAVNFVVGPVRQSITAPATRPVYLGCQANVAVGTTASVFAFIRARRIR